MDGLLGSFLRGESLPARGVRIEIFGPFGQAKRDRVALLTESVD